MLIWYYFDSPISCYVCCCPLSCVHINSLIINATKLISVNFVVNNTGDEVAGISLTLSGAPSYVQSVQVTKMVSDFGAWLSLCNAQ